MHLKPAPAPAPAHACHLHVTCTFNYTWSHTCTCTINNLRWTETGDSYENQRTCWGPSRYSVRAQGHEKLRTSPWIEILRTCTAPDRESSNVTTDTRCFVRAWGYESLRTCTLVPGASRDTNQQEVNPPRPCSDTWTMAWHILPSDANPREQPMGENTLSLT